MVDYLQKPFSIDRFYQAVQKAQEKYIAGTGSQAGFQEKEDAKKYIFVKSDKKIIRLAFEDIHFIEAYGDYIKIQTSKEMIMVLMSLKNAQEQLPGDRFSRIHKSHIIALDKIELIEGNMVKIGEKKLPVGKSYRRDFFELVKPE